MQSISPLTTADFLARVKTCKYKLEIYDGTTWHDLHAFGSPARSRVKTISFSPGGSGPTPAVKAGTWSATIGNADGFFHPFHPTSTYASLLRVGRQVRISVGFKKSGTTYTWRRLTGYMNAPVFGKATVEISGVDFSKALTDYSLNWPDNYWGDVATFDAMSSTGVSGTEIYAEADALRIASEVNGYGGWSSADGLAPDSVADAGGGSTYAIKYVRDPIGGVLYSHESNVGSVAAGEQYFISFKSKPVSGTGWSIRFYQTVGGVLTLIDTVYVDGAAAWGTHSVRITALKTGALEMRAYSASGSSGDELRLDQVSIKFYEAAWNVYQLPAACNGPYYVTLGQFASAENADIFSPSVGTTYIVGIRYKRVSGSGTTWIGVYQTISGVFTLIEKIPLTSMSWTTAFGSFEATSAVAVQLRLISEDGDEDDETRLAWVSIKAFSPGAPELYAEADALDIVNEAGNVTNWTALSGCTFNHDADASGGDSYVAVFKRTGPYAEQVMQGSRDNNGDWDGWLYTPSTQQFRFDYDRVVETGTANLNIYYYTDAAPENMVARILWKAGYYASEAAALAAMSYTATGVIIERPRFDSGTKGSECIRQICERVNYRFWFDYDGVPNFKPAPAVKATADYTLASYGNLSDQPCEQDLEQIRNIVTIEGDEERPFARTDDQRDSKFSATALDQDSIDVYGKSGEPISNILFQEAAPTIAMCATILAEGKDPKWYSTVIMPFNPVPLEVGDTIEWPAKIGGIDVAIKGIIRDIEVNQYRFSYRVEVASHAAA